MRQIPDPPTAATPPVAPRVRNVGGRALEIWLQINPDSDAAELLEVLAEEGILARIEDVRSTFGEYRPGTAYWLLPKDEVVAFVKGRHLVGLRRVTPTQAALVCGKEPPAPSQPAAPVHPERLARGDHWGPRNLPARRDELMALQAEARRELQKLAPREQYPVQCALARIKEALRATPGPPGANRVDVLSKIVLRLLRHHLTPEEIAALEAGASHLRAQDES